MAIDLLNSFLQRGQNVSSNQKNSASAATQTTQNLPANLQVMRAIKALQAGQTLQGEVVSVKGDEVQIAVRDVLIDARLAQSMNLTAGMTMPFQVKANTAQGLSLIPLFTNTAANPNAIKALEMAQLPVNGRTVEMVQNMMEKGMPIDKQSIQEMYRDVTAFKDAVVRDIVSLHQMKMPVTEEHLTQIDMYHNNQHCLKDAFTNMGDAIGKHLESLVTEGKSQSAINLVREIQQLFREAEAKTAAEKGDSDLLAKGREDKNFFSEKDILSQEAKNVFGVSDWEALTKAMMREKVPGKISALFEKIWNRQTSRHWMMEPETVMDKEKVKGFYDKVNSQIRELEQIFKSFNMEKSPAARVIQNTASNLDFMNQLNQMHAYIQLPLKMANQNAHGELYVFANRKNLSKQNGKVSALLHLDMQNLGNMDVYVALENQKVSTNFYLEKEEYMDFLELHMDMLTARLNKRGYTCEVKTSLRNAESEPVISMIEKQQGQPMLLSMQAFDVRA